MNLDEIEFRCVEHHGTIGPDFKTKGEYWRVRNTIFNHNPTSEEIEEVYKLNAKERKERPIASGVLNYFPLALMEVAYCSLVGNEQHNPGTPLHWDRSKSGDEWDAMMRHFLDRGKIDDDGVRHSAKVAWRALAALEKELEALRHKEEPRDFTTDKCTISATESYLPSLPWVGAATESANKGCSFRDCKCKGKTGL